MSNPYKRGKDNHEVVVTGASGFIGRHTIAALTKSGFDVIALCRSAAPASKPSVTYYGNVDVTDPSSLDPAYFVGADAVVHLVGIIAEHPPLQTFARIHIQGTRNVADAAKKAGVSKLVYLSAIGAAPDAPAEYSRTKYAAEEIVRASGIDFTILRPSIVLGPGSGFGKQMQELVRFGGLPIKLPIPLIPLPGSGENLFQPVDIDDLTRCITRSLTDNNARNQEIAVAGADQVSFNHLVEAFATAEHVAKPILHIPIALLSLVAPLVEILPQPPFTADQLKNLQLDNIADLSALRDTFHFEPAGLTQQIDHIYS